MEARFLPRRTPYGLVGHILVFHALLPSEEIHELQLLSIVATPSGNPFAAGLCRAIVQVSWACARRVLYTCSRFFIFLHMRFPGLACVVCVTCKVSMRVTSRVRVGLLKLHSLSRVSVLALAIRHGLLECGHTHTSPRVPYQPAPRLLSIVMQFLNHVRTLPPKPLGTAHRRRVRRSTQAGRLRAKSGYVG